MKPYLYARFRRPKTPHPDTQEEDPHPNDNPIFGDGWHRYPTLAAIYIHTKQVRTKVDDDEANRLLHEFYEGKTKEELVEILIYQAHPAYDYMAARVARAKQVTDPDYGDYAETTTEEDQ